MDPQGSAVIGDFGCARMTRYSDYTALVPMSSNLKGTPAFLAPELFSGGNNSQEADVWAFGMTVYVRPR